MTTTSLHRPRAFGYSRQPDTRGTPASGFLSLGEQLRAIANIALNPHRPIDPRLQLRAAAGGSEAVPADGGFLIATEFSREIIRRAYQVGEILRRCTQIPVTQPNSNGVKFPQFSEDSRANGSRLGGVRVWWENEADAGITSKPRFQLSEMVAHKAIGLLYLTRELMSDSAAMDSWAQWAFSQELAFTLENYIITGAGDGVPQGVLNAPCLITVAKEGGQAAGTVVGNNVMNMLSRLWQPSRPNALFLYNPDLLPQLAQLVITIGTAGAMTFIFQFAQGDGQWDTLGGLPAVPSEYCQAAGTPGDVILADFSRYVVMMRQTVKADVSIHVRFLTDESAFRFVVRCNGQPIDRSPIVPLYASNTRSPFITIAAR